MRGDRPVQHATRRDVVASGLAIGACSLLPGCATGSMTGEADKAVRDIVLIHGAWHGGWCWESVTELLETAGYRIHAPTLPGLAERADELGPDIGLETHIADATAFIEERGLTDFVLCGHSYGGMVITGIADALKDRIAHIVYLDAALPKDGESMISYGEPRPAEAIAAAEAGLRALATDGIGIPPLPPSVFGIPADHPRHDWAAERLTAHPLKTWFDPISLTNDGPAGLPRTYVLCTSPVLAQTQFPYIAKRAEADPAWQYRELETGHDAMITDPEGVAAILLEAAQPREVSR